MDAMKKARIRSINCSTLLPFLHPGDDIIHVTIRWLKPRLPEVLCSISTNFSISGETMHDPQQSEFENVYYRNHEHSRS